jgi:phage terminase large subunit-like protein
MGPDHRLHLVDQRREGSPDVLLSRSAKEIEVDVSIPNRAMDWTSCGLILRRKERFYLVICCVDRTGAPRFFDRLAAEPQSGFRK